MQTYSSACFWATFFWLILESIPLRFFSADVFVCTLLSYILLACSGVNLASLFSAHHLWGTIVPSTHYIVHTYLCACFLPTFFWLALPSSCPLPTAAATKAHRPALLCLSSRCPLPTAAATKAHEPALLILSSHCQLPTAAATKAHELASSWSSLGCQWEQLVLSTLSVLAV
ncbi:hypothetical protein EI94DRAFT_1700172 [Lactarius quietus]|nr:hypothetical protein EI94DRAFT_1700172 [Lactarius quietus]